MKAQSELTVDRKSAFKDCAKTLVIKSVAGGVVEKYTKENQIKFETI